MNHPGSPGRKTFRGLSDATRAARVAGRRERFLTAGLDVFGTIGLRQATVKGLCKAAGLTERYFYESFSTIEDLFCAVYQAQTQRIREHFLAAIPKMPRALDQRIHLALTSYFSMMRDQRVVRILHMEAMGAGDRVSAMREADLQLAWQVAAFLLRSDNPELQLSEELAMATGFAINGAVTALAIQWMKGGYQVSMDIIVESGSLVVQGTMTLLRERCRTHHEP